MPKFAAPPVNPLISSNDEESTEQQFLTGVPILQVMVVSVPVPSLKESHACDETMQSDRIPVKKNLV